MTTKPKGFSSRPRESGRRSSGPASGRDGSGAQGMAKLLPVPVYVKVAIATMCAIVGAGILGKLLGGAYCILLRHLS